MQQGVEKQLILIFPAKESFLETVIFRTFVTPYSPHSLLVLAGMTPKDYRIKIYNQKFFWSKKDYTGRALVAISCCTANAYESYQLGDAFRKAGAAVVMGGVHVSYLPEEALQHCDSVVIGEAESVWPQVIKDYENGALQKTYRGVPLKDWSSPSYKYFLSLPPSVLQKVGLLFGRGCKYRCEFCVPFFGNPRPMPLEQAKGLIARTFGDPSAVPKGQLVNFYDDNIFADPDYAKSLFRELIPFHCLWLGSSSIDIAFDEEALQLAKASGCVRLFVGFESIYPGRFSKTALRGIKTAEDYITAIKKIKSYGIQVKGGFVVGFDDCTHTYCFDLLKFLLRSRLDAVDIAILTPLPGSRIFERMKADNRLVTYDWRKFDTGHYVVFKPKHMSPAVLYLWTWVLIIGGMTLAPTRGLRILKVLVMAGSFFCFIFFLAIVLVRKIKFLIFELMMVIYLLLMAVHWVLRFLCDLFG